MASRQQKFYMVRVSGGLWEPKIKHTNLTKAMDTAFKMAEFHCKPATVLQTVCRVEIVDGKPIWKDVAPEK